MMPLLYYTRALSATQLIEVYPLTFGRARLGVRHPEDLAYRDVW